MSHLSAAAATNGVACALIGASPRRTSQQDHQTLYHHQSHLHHHLLHLKTWESQLLKIHRQTMVEKLQKTDLRQNLGARIPKFQ